MPSLLLAHLVKKRQIPRNWSTDIREELNRLDAAEAERLRQQQELEELERSLAESSAISIPMLTVIRIQIHLVTAQETVIPLRTTSPVSWRKFRCAAMNVRKP